MIKSIDSLTVVVKELTSKRSFIPSKQITKSSTPLKDKRRIKAISQVLSFIKSIKIVTQFPCTVEQIPRVIGEQG